MFLFTNPLFLKMLHHLSQVLDLIDIFVK